MKILSWNIYKDNQRINAAIDFLKGQEADIVCLQELPISALERFKGIGGHMVFEKEQMTYKNGRKKPDAMYSVIISRLPMDGYGTISHRHFYEDVTRQDDRYEEFKSDSLYMDVTEGGRQVRIFNVHLKCVAGPHYRLSQFKEVLAHFDPKRENIVCGDFNTFGHPLVNLFVWQYFGYRAREFLVREREALEEAFGHHRLVNPFKGYTTFLKFPLQLDYIVLPHTTTVRALKRHNRPHGSDHLPIHVEI